MNIYARHTTEHLAYGRSPINHTGQPLGGYAGYTEILDPGAWHTGPVHRPRTPGALLYTTNFWWPSPDGSISGGGLCHDPFLQNGGPGRITGLRLLGPGADPSIMDLDDRPWVGGALGFKMPKEALPGVCRFDNNAVDCFSHMAVWCGRIYDGSSVEHCELSNSLTQGFGYGLWPGEPASPGAMLHVRGNLFRLPPPGSPALRFHRIYWADEGLSGTADDLLWQHVFSTAGIAHLIDDEDGRKRHIQSPNSVVRGSAHPHRLVAQPD